MMLKILTTTFFSAAAIYLLYFSLLQPDLSKSGVRQPKQAANTLHIGCMLLIGLLVRCIIGFNVYGHETDMNCFTAWSDIVFNDGISAFYASDGFSDYPPGYMYVLYVIGALKSFLPLSSSGVVLLVKMPSIICDVITAFFVYKIAREHMSHSCSMFVSAFYLFNPAVLLNSSIWGQVDAVSTLLLLIMVYLTSKKKLIPAYYVFALAIFTKPQALIVTPVLLYGIVENVFLPKFDKTKFFKHLLCGIGAIAMIVVLAVPFGLNYVVEQYIATLSSYPYVTINAFNIWGMFGLNWTALNAFTTTMGYIFIVLIVIGTAIVFFKSKNDSKYYFVAALLVFGTFMLSTKMHERYAFSAMLMMLCAFSVLHNSHIFNSYMLISMSQLFNTAWALFIYETDINKYFKSKVINAGSAVNLVITAYIIYVTVKLYIKNQTENKQATQKTADTQSVKNTAASSETFSKKRSLFERTEEFVKITRFDIIAMVVITAVYSAVALYDLGDKVAPQSSFEVSNGDKIVLDLGENKQVKEFRYFLGVTENREFKMNAADTVNSTNVSKLLKMSSVFAWGTENINANIRYITLDCTSDNAQINELAIIGDDGKCIIPVNSDEYSELFDEQDIVPERASFRNGTYFDEIYHARTAYEFVHSLNPYEWTHPPLGKVFISIGVMIFGMVPFGWRIVGTLFGVAMVPVIYCFAKKLTKYSWLAIVTCLAFTFDFMHFAQTRIATIDVYVTFFIMLMYYFMYKYYKTSFYDTKFSKTLIPLGLSGLFMGFGIASKWTGVYAGCGLAIIFFITLYKRYREYMYACINPRGEHDGIAHSFIIKNFKSYTIKTIIFCVGAFVIVPLLIYGLSYIPYLRADGMHGIKSILENQSAMLTYHGKTVVNSTHSYSSPWYQWPIMVRPIWYYSGVVTDTVKEGISAFGNPAVWWTSIAAFIYMLYLTVIKKDKTALFLVISYLAQLVSWIPVTRITFIYHYFPSVPFLVLMIGYAIYTIYNNKKSKKVFYYSIGYVAVVIVLFIMFYPVLSGQPISVDYVLKYLRWFDSWVLISG